MRQKKRKTTEKETRHQCRHDSLHWTITSDIVVCLFASDLMHNSTGYVVKQLAHAFSCALSSYEALGSLESTQEARVALGYRLGQLLRFFRALQTSRVLHNSIVNNYSPKWRWLVVDIRELTDRRLLHDATVRLRDMLTAHAFLSTCQLRAKVDDVGGSDLPASWKQEDVRLVFKVFSRCFGYFC